MSPYEHVEVAAPGAAVLAALREGLRSRGLTEYAVVDIPLRLAVIGRAGERSAIVIRPMGTLLGDEHADLADRFTAVLRALADEARAGAERAGGPGPASPP